MKRCSFPCQIRCTGATSRHDREPETEAGHSPHHWGAADSRATITKQVTNEVGQLTHPLHPNSEKKGLGVKGHKRKCDLTWSRSLVIQQVQGIYGQRSKATTECCRSPCQTTLQRCDFPKKGIFPWEGHSPLYWGAANVCRSASNKVLEKTKGVHPTQPTQCRGSHMGPPCEGMGWGESITVRVVFRAWL